MASAAQHRAERAGIGQRPRRADVQGRAQHCRDQPRPDVGTAIVGPEHAASSSAGFDGRGQGPARPDQRDFGPGGGAIDGHRRSQQLGHHPPARAISRPRGPVCRLVQALRQDPSCRGEPGQQDGGNPQEHGGRTASDRRRLSQRLRDREEPGSFSGQEREGSRRPGRPHRPGRSQIARPRKRRRHLPQPLQQFPREAAERDAESELSAQRSAPDQHCHQAGPQEFAAHGAGAGGRPGGWSLPRLWPRIRSRAAQRRLADPRRGRG